MTVRGQESRDGARVMACKYVSVWEEKEGLGFRF